MNFKTINDLNNIIKNNIYKINNKYDLIVAIPRSGFLPGTIISLYLNIPLTDFDNFLDEKIYGLGASKTKENWIKNLDESKRILIVEDSCSTGKSIIEAKEKLKNFKYADKCDFLSIFVTKDSKKFVDIYFDVCELPRMFEWNYIHHQGVIDACFDIDGVLCENPSQEENDDGPKYISFIKNAKIKFLPTFTIGCIVTSRLEKYREETEEWLKNNNIKYNKLVMMNLQSKEERVKLGNHGQFKGEIYKSNKNAKIFVESNPYQAMEISRISKKCVFCTETSEVFEDGMLSKVNDKNKVLLKKYLPKPIFNFLKKIKNINKK